jgi:hypothetical protein
MPVITLCMPGKPITVTLAGWLSLKESRERRIWIFADKFPQLARFEPLLDLSRPPSIRSSV